MAAPELESHYRRLERMYHSAPVNAYFEPRLRVSGEGATIELPVKPTSFHAGGALHGSVYFKALDDAAIFAAYSEEAEVFVVTASFTVYLLRPVDGGTLRARGTVVSRTGRTYVAESVVTSNGEEVARGSGLLLRTGTPLENVPGYLENG